MSAALDTLLAELGSQVEIAEKGEQRGLARDSVLRLGWAELNEALPDGGFPRGIVELSSSRALAGATSIALAAVRAAQERDARAFCAWIDPEATLHAPGVVAKGVDLARLLVVRPPRKDLGRIAVKVCASGAFDVVVVDADPIPFALAPSVNEERTPRRASQNARRRNERYEGEMLVRKLALAAERAGSTVLLLTDSGAPRAAPWPVALRLELSRPMPFDSVLRVAKDRRGRVGMKKTIPFEEALRAAGAESASRSRLRSARRRR